MEYQYFMYCSCYTTFLYSVTCVHGNMPTLLKKCSVSSSKKRRKKKRENFSNNIQLTMKGLQYSANAQACVIMSLSIYLYHKRIHKNPMLRVTCWNRSWLSFKKVGERREKKKKEVSSLMIYIVPRQRQHCDTVRIHVEIIRKRCEEFHTQTQDIQIQQKIKSLPEVFHPVCEKSAGSTSLFCCFLGRGVSVCVGEACFFFFLPHTGTKLFMFFSCLNTAIQRKFFF